MIRRLIAFAFAAALVAIGAARAACIDETAVWSVPYPQGNIQAVSYYVWQQAPQPPPTLLSIVYRSGEFHIHKDVPTAVAQRFFGIQSADSVYQSYVKTRYRQLLVSENNCPLLNETGDVYLLGERP